MPGVKEDGLAFCSQEIVHKRRHVDAHERNQCAEVKHLRTEVISKDERARQRKDAYKNNVVAGNPRARIYRGKKLPRNGVIAPHPIEQPARPQMRPRSRTYTRDQQR